MRLRIYRHIAIIVLRLVLLAAICGVVLPLPDEAADASPTVSAAKPKESGLLGTPSRWTNSLGMEFVAVPGTEALFCVWKTRVQDFEKFVEETHYDAIKTGWMWPLFGDTANGRALAKKGSWKNPGFKQGPTHPVSAVSWEDAHAFCSWLTKREHQMGAIGSDKIYRLPTDEEWSSAVGNRKYCWGDQWPPPAAAGNSAGEEVLAADWPTNRPTISGYRDGFARTSPVGSSPANPYGLYDLAGNLAEWCEDLFRKEMNPDDLRKQSPNVDLASSDSRVLRGASWGAASPFALTTFKRTWAPPDVRSEGIGFRVVIAREEAGGPPRDASQTKTNGTSGKP